MKVLFDTNIFRDVQRGRISADQVKQARRKITEASAQSCVSPLTLVELGSHVCDEEKTHYEKYRCAFEAITALCDTALADPEMFMRREVFGAPLGQYGLSATDTLRIIRLIAKTPRYTTLRKGQVTLWGPTPSRVFLKTGYLKQFRDKYETQYIQDMERCVLDILIPDHRTSRTTGVQPHLADPKLLAKFSAFLDSPEFENVFYAFAAARVNIALIGVTFDTPHDKKAKSKLAAYCAAYKWILAKIAEAGYNPKKHKNDYNDLHFLVYMADPSLTFVTHDGGMARKIQDASTKSRILSFAEWLAT